MDPDVTLSGTPIVTSHRDSVAPQTPTSPSTLTHQCHPLWDITHPPTPWGPCVPMDPDVIPSGTPIVTNRPQCHHP